MKSLNLKIWGLDLLSSLVQLCIVLVVDKIATSFLSFDFICTVYEERQIFFIFFKMTSFTQRFTVFVSNTSSGKSTPIFCSVPTIVMFFSRSLLAISTLVYKRSMEMFLPSSLTCSFVRITRFLIVSS